MEIFIRKFLKKEQVQLSELSDFIVKYCELIKNKIPTAQEIQAITQLIQMQQFNINYAIKNACIKLNIQHIEMFDKNGQYIKSYIQD